MTGSFPRAPHSLHSFFDAQHKNLHSEQTQSPISYQCSMPLVTGQRRYVIYASVLTISGLPILQRWSSRTGALLPTPPCGNLRPVLHISSASHSLSAGRCNQTGMNAILDMPDSKSNPGRVASSLTCWNILQPTGGPKNCSNPNTFFLGMMSSF